MKPNFNWDGQAIGPRIYKMPQAIATFILAYLTPVSLGLTLGAAANAIALGIGYAVVGAAGYLLSGIGAQKKPAAPQASDVQSNIRQDISARRRVYARSLVGSIIVFGFRRGEKSYLLHYICEGPIEGFVSFRLDKKPITLDVDGFVEQAQYVVGGRSRVQILTTLGTMSDGPFDELIDAFPELDTPLTPFRHRGCAMALQIVEQVPQANLQDTYPNNMPSLQFVIDGLDNIYDPRTETTAFTGNAGLCLLAETMDVYGLTPADIDEISLESFGDFADHCDEAIALKAGGTEPRYRCAGMITLDAENEDRIQAIARICNADVYMDSQGRIAVQQKMRSTPGIALRAKNGDHLSIQLEGGRSIQKQFNTAKVTYTEPAMNYKANEVRWQDVDLFDEDGGEFSSPVSATLCPSATQAMRLGKLAVFEANPDFTGSVTSGPQALDLMEDYAFTLDLSPEDDFERVACASGVIEYDGAAMTVSAPMVIFRAGANDWTAAVDEQDEVVIPVDLPSNVDDIALDVTVTVEIQANSAPRLVFSWEPVGAVALPDSYSQLVEISPTGADEWVSANVNQDEDTATIGPVADGAAYDWRIRNVASGKTFDWQNSIVPVTVTVYPTPPIALTSFSLVGSAPHLGNAQFSIVTANDSNLRTVKIYRKATGVALNVGVDTPISPPLALAPLSTYGYVDGDATRTDLIVNGDMASGTGWTLGTNITISGGTANKAAGASIQDLSRLISNVTTGKTVRGKFNITSWTSGNVRARLRNNGAGTSQDATDKNTVGEHLFSLVTTTDRDRAGVRFDTASVGSIDNYIAYEASASCAPQGTWDWYAVPFNGSNVAGPPSGPVTATII